MIKISDIAWYYDVPESFVDDVFSLVKGYKFNQEKSDNDCYVFSNSKKDIYFDSLQEIVDISISEDEKCLELALHLGIISLDEYYQILDSKEEEFVGSYWDMRINEVREGVI